MANKTTTTVKSKSGKQYNYCRISPIVEIYDEASGEFRRVKKQFCGKNEKDAKAKIAAHEKFIKDLKLELSRSPREKQESRPFGDYMRWYILNVFVIDNAIKASTKTRYINSYLNIFYDKESLKKPISELTKEDDRAGNGILLMPLKDVTGEDLQTVFINAEQAPSSKVAALKLIRNFYKYLASQKITSDITQKIKIPHPEKDESNQQIETYSEIELQMFKDRIPQNHRLRFLVILAIETGARIAELCALTYDDIDINGGQIIINKALAEITPLKGEDSKARVEISSTKSKESKRSVPIDDDVIKEFHYHKKWHHEEMLRTPYRSNYVFTTSTGHLYYKSTLRTALKRLCISIDIQPKGWHCFRHSYGSHMAAAGNPISEVSKMMGHSDVSITSKYYINVASEQKRQAYDKYKEYMRSKQAASGM